MRQYVLLIACLLCAPFAIADSVDNDMLLKLDNSLKEREKYEQEKLSEIKRLNTKAREARTPEQLYNAYEDLYDAYKAYKYDSAFVYANKMMGVAKRLQNPDYTLMAHCAKTFCLLSAGLYTEASVEIETADLAGTTPSARQQYYWTLTRLNYDMADYNHAQPYCDDYIKKGGVYTDSLLNYLQPNTIEWLYTQGMRQMKERHYSDCVQTFKTLLQQDDISLHDKAVITSSLGWISVFQNDEEQALRYLAEAAIYDNESATKETTALCVLAGFLYKRGDIARATQYVQFALDDANFYDARQRKIEVGNILPIIEQDRYNIMRKQRNTMLTAVIITVLFAIAMLLAVYSIRRQIKRLQAARRTIEERNQDLQQANSRLKEANKIKNEYIGKSFYINAEYIEKVEKLYKTVDRKIATRQYEDLRSSLKESTLMAERKNMYAGFDETFLTLFPNFVERFNELFEEADRRLPDNDKGLTTEMRIFALIRLGVTDSERIAKFLNYSVHTINTYKTRVKNKSTVENDLFEQRIMEI